MARPNLSNKGSDQKASPLASLIDSVNYSKKGTISPDRTPTLLGQPSPLVRVLLFPSLQSALEKGYGWVMLGYRRKTYHGRCI